MYYYGARYYNPRESIFLSVDPMAEMMPNVSPYVYALQNPVKFIDPTGMVAEDSAGDPPSKNQSTVWDSIKKKGSELLKEAKEVASKVYEKTATRISAELDITKGNSYDYWYGEDGYTYLVTNDDRFFKVTTSERYEQVSQLPSLEQSIDGSGIIPIGRAGKVAKGIALMGKTGKIHGVYLSLNAKKMVQYVGITNNFAKRAAQHLASKGINIEKIKGLQNLVRSDARAVEQVLIEYYGLGGKAGQTGQLMNRINSISSKNKLYGNSLKRGKELLEQAGFKF